MIAVSMGPAEREQAQAHVARRQRLFGVKRPLLAKFRPALIAPPPPEPAAIYPQKPTSSAALITMICAKHGITRDELMSMSRGRDIVRCRQECCYELRQRIEIKGEPISLPAIGRLLGGLDHTTVLHGIRKHAQLIADEKEPAR